MVKYFQMELLYLLAFSILMILILKWRTGCFLPPLWNTLLAMETVL